VVSVRVPSLQVQGCDVKPQYCQKRRNYIAIWCMFLTLLCKATKSCVLFQLYISSIPDSIFNDIRSKINFCDLYNIFSLGKFKSCNFSEVFYMCVCVCVCMCMCASVCDLFSQSLLVRVNSAPSS
jgi:hypothetical protein